jgi:hypothetical protein
VVSAAIFGKRIIFQPAVSDNGDRNRILATIVRSIDFYTARYPRRWVYFTGNTNGKARLYRMAVTLHFEELSEKFESYCRVDGTPEFLRFQEGVVVSGFLIKRKLGIYEKDNKKNFDRSFLGRRV